MQTFLSSRDSPVGPLIAAANDEALCVLQFSEAAAVAQHMDELRVRYAGTVREGSNAILEESWSQLEQYFRGARQEFTLPLAYPGTQFQEQVWSALREIRFGETWSYLDLARRIGDTGATRAVGMANGANPIAIVIPCHRVVNANGDLGGYGGGLWRKRILLDLERGQGRLPF
ncbi:MAG TPA: methylated-DNA--[protein]-cysteine S-methyltransferase [Steroidobacteraceae bacterium]|nr:methylated-DNA--[protein]-cysteine S-methyltransferase [Steroidobacteraceae bacterium]